MQSKSLLGTEIVRPFLEETVEVFEVQASTIVEAGTIVDKDDLTGLTGDVTGIIGIVSDKFVGAIAISFPEETLMIVVSRILSETMNGFSRDVIDGAGELCNIISARAKTRLNQRGLNVKTALPSIVVGKRHHLNFRKGARRTVIPFTSDAGEFSVEIFIVESVSV